MQLFTAKPADAAEIAQFLTAETGKKWDEMTIQNEIADHVQYCVRQGQKMLAVFSIKPLGQNARLIYRIYVAEPLRGKGIGSAILTVSKKRADQTGEPLYAECEQHAENLLHFLDKNGFRQLSSYTDKTTAVAVCGYIPDKK